MRIDKSPTEEVLEMRKISFTGNIIPHMWYQKLKLPSGRVNLPAIIILSEICYWYRPTEIRDEFTGELLRLEKRFYADKLQRKYSSFQHLGLTKKQAYDACHFLQDCGLISLETRTIETKEHDRIPNVLFIGIFPKAIEELNSALPTSNGALPTSNEPLPVSNTYTENTQKTTHSENIATSFFGEEDSVDVREVEEPPKISPKPLKQTKFKVDEFARRMPIDFSVKPAIIEDAINLGYEPTDVTDSAVKFVEYYTNGKGRPIKHRNWEHKFIYEWLDRGHKNGYLKRNGTFYKLDANEERIESIKKLIDPNLFAHIED